MNKTFHFIYRRRSHSVLITLNQPKQHTVLSTFRHHEPRMGQAFTYGRPAPEVSPDEGFRREAETSTKQYVVLVDLE